MLMQVNIVQKVMNVIIFFSKIKKNVEILIQASYLKFVSNEKSDAFSGKITQFSV